MKYIFETLSIAFTVLLFFASALLLSFFIGHLDPAYADYVVKQPSPSSYRINIGLRPGESRPNYKKQVEYINSNKCVAIAVIPYGGEVYYTCPNGDNFWSSVLTPVPNASPSLYMKNKKNQDNQDDANMAASVAASTVIMNSSY